METSTCTASSHFPELTQVFLNAWPLAEKEKLGLKAFPLLFFDFFAKGCSWFLQQGDETGNEGNLLVFIKSH